MRSDIETGYVYFVSGLLVGAFIGASVALLTAPQSGRKTRRRIVRAADDVRTTATDQLEEIADEVKGRVDEAIRGARRKLGA